MELNTQNHDQQFVSCLDFMTSAYQGIQKAHYVARYPAFIHPQYSGRASQDSNGKIFGSKKKSKSPNKQTRETLTKKHIKASNEPQLLKNFLPLGRGHS